MKRVCRRLGLGDLPTRLRWYVVGVVALAAPLVVTAAATATPPSANAAPWLGGFLLLAFLADLKPVPLDEHGGHAVSLAFIFILAGQLLFGWQYAVLIGVTGILCAQLIERRPPTRLAFNGAAYALAGAAGAAPTLALGLDGGMGVGAVTISAFAGALFVVTNVALVCGAMALQQGTPLVSLLRENARHSGPAFVIMAFIAALATTLFQQAPTSLLLLAGPMVALTMYQRSALATRIAAKDALTDDLTCLGNRRAYESELREALERAGETGSPLSLCVVDIDSFKQINDVYGHLTGDGVLIALAEILREGGAAAFRLGGDELALPLELDTTAAYAVAEKLQERVATHPFPANAPVTISVGIASYPAHAEEVVVLERAADDALYHAKHAGRSRTCVYTPALARTFPPHELAERVEREARLRAAENLVRVVDAKDTYVGTHSASVARIAGEIALQLDLDDEEASNVRLAARLHDLGKIAIPDRILQKPKALTLDEARLMRTHPELGASLLDGLEIGPVDQWIRHHHEHWDGSGYPDRLVADAIPLGSRIILVADAFDAMTSNRSYRPAMPVEAALAELTAKAASQFDPEIVAALMSWLAAEEAGLDDSELEPAMAA